MTEVNTTSLPEYTDASIFAALRYWAIRLIAGKATVLLNARIRHERGPHNTMVFSGMKHGVLLYDSEIYTYGDNVSVVVESKFSEPGIDKTEYINGVHLKHDAEYGEL